MNYRGLIKYGLSWLVNPVEAAQLSKALHGREVRANREHIRLAADWLLKAHNANGTDGYARQYIVYKRKWDADYIETTGYIVETLFQVARYLKDDTYARSALKAARWLVGIQNPDGSFSDIDSGRSQAFDTGQCLIGLQAVYEHTSDELVLAATRQAADWLVKAQDDDGSWTRFGYQSRPHAYYTRVAATLAEFSRLTGESKYLESATQNIQWTLEQQLDNGYFRHMEFGPDELPYLHTMVYVMEGLIRYHSLTEETRVLDAALKSARGLREMNLTRDLVLYSQYDADYRPRNREKCLVGLAQWAGVCVELYQLTYDRAYLELASRTLYYLKGKQIKKGKNLCGSLPSSLPVYGHYGEVSLFNWNSKFFIDSLIKYDAHSVTLDREHDAWVAGCFAFADGAVVSTALSTVDQQYLAAMTPYVEVTAQNGGTVLDLGCGKGKFLTYLATQYPSLNLVGVDPVFHGMEEHDVLDGTCNQIPLGNGSVDLVMVIEVLQHVRNIPGALDEISRTLKPGGLLVIGERNPYSIMGLLKPLWERLGRWMYPPDSPFQERWYPLGTWRNQLSEGGYELLKVQKVRQLQSWVPGKHRYYLLVAQKAVSRQRSNISR